MIILDRYRVSRVLRNIIIYGNQFHFVLISRSYIFCPGGDTMNLSPGWEAESVMVDVCSCISSLMVTISGKLPRPGLGLCCLLLASSTGPDITFTSSSTMARRVDTTPGLAACQYTSWWRLLKSSNMAWNPSAAVKSACDMWEQSITTFILDWPCLMAALVTRFLM